MKGGVRRTYHASGGAECGAHDLRIGRHRGERTGANLRAHRAAHVLQCACDAAADHDQIWIKDVDEGRDRNAEVVARGREAAKCDAITPVRRAGQAPYAEVSLLIEVALRQVAAWAKPALD